MGNFPPGLADSAALMLLAPTAHAIPITASIAIYPRTRDLLLPNSATEVILVSEIWRMSD